MKGSVRKNDRMSSSELELRYTLGFGYDFLPPSIQNRFALIWEKQTHPGCRTKIDRRLSPACRFLRAVASLRPRATTERNVGSPKQPHFSVGVHLLTILEANVLERNADVASCRFVCALLNQDT